MIFRGSRYVDSYLIKDKDNGIDYLSFPELHTHQKEHGDLVYQFQSGDRLDLLADKFYGDSQLGWKILKANPSYMHECEITEGAILTIPNPQGGDF